MDVRCTVLGPVEVTADGTPLTGMAPRHRAVLAYLLLHARTALSAERLIDAVWGPAPPSTARSQIHAAVTAIRRMLRTAGAEHVLATRPAGYVINPDRFDLDEFTSQVTADDGDTDAAAHRIRAALGLWRGEPLADVQAEYVPAARARLEERRLAAVERLAELDLSLGRHHELIDELTGLVEANPLREGLVTALMRARYRSGRQVDALSAARAFRTALADELGLDPTAAFTALEAAILRSDPGLDPPVAEPATPRQVNFLPYDIPDFTGRVPELDRITDVPPGATGLLTVDGMAGVGKTSLAVHAAHRLAPRYPDGQLFLDLRGHTAGLAPLTAAEALDDLLRQLGVPAERIPADVAGRAAVWRSELAGRRVLAVLDNAVDADQVRDLLPGPSPGLFLITSRRRLTDLDGARALSMDVLPAADAVDLFTRVVGDRARAEPIAVLDVLQLCGFLPLAVRISAARLHHRPQWSVEYLADRLRDQRRRLAELSTPDRGVAAAFALSYQQLAPGHQRVFRLLGLHPGHDITPDAAAALADVAEPDAESTLEDLLDAHMLLQHVPGRYTCHDLLREHARAAAESETGQARRDALTRLIVHYLEAADTAVRRPAPAWLEAERANLIAIALHTTDPALPQDAARLSATLHRHLYDRAQHTDAEARYTDALEAHRRRGDQAGEARVLIDLGWVHWLRGLYRSSADHFRQALDLSERIADTFGRARAHQGLGNVDARRRDDPRSEHHFRAALPLFREIGDRSGEAGVLTGLGATLSRTERHEQAVHCHEQALEVCRDVGDAGGTGDALNNLAVAHRELGRYDRATALHHQALDTHRSINFRSGEAVTLNDLGETERRAGDPTDAVTHHTAALAIANEIGSRPEQARAHEGLARAQAARGHHDAARHHAREAADLYADFGVPQAQDVRELTGTLASSPTPATDP